MQALLRMLEETVPVAQIWLDAAEKPEAASTPFALAPERELRSIMKTIFEGLVAQGLSEAAARDRVAALEPFNAHPELTATLLEAEAEVQTELYAAIRSMATTLITATTTNQELLERDDIAACVDKVLQHESGMGES